MPYCGLCARVSDCALSESAELSGPDPVLDLCDIACIALCGAALACVAACAETAEKRMAARPRTTVFEADMMNFHMRGSAFPSP